MTVAFGKVPLTDSLSKYWLLVRPSLNLPAKQDSSACERSSIPFKQLEACRTAMSNFIVLRGGVDIKVEQLSSALLFHGASREPSSTAHTVTEQHTDPALQDSGCK